MRLQYVHTSDNKYVHLFPIQVVHFILIQVLQQKKQLQPQHSEVIAAFAEARPCHTCCSRYSAGVITFKLPISSEG